MVAGRGNNGGDGFVAAAELPAAAAKCRSFCCASATSLTGRRRVGGARLEGALLPFNPHAIGTPALIIDALFGAGLNRAVKGDPLDMIEAINASGVPVLSVDLPSGINGTTGAVMGAAVSRPKP